MKFGPVALDEALGAVAGHTVRLRGGGAIKKGAVLGAAELSALRAAGHGSIVAARLDVDDVAEDAAAHRVASRAAGGGVRLAEAVTGRCNLHAVADGLCEVDRERIDRLNLVDEAVTLATLAAHSPVRAGDMVATVKIIPYGVRREVIAACEAAVAGGAVSVAAFRPYTAGLVLTRLPGVPESVLDRAASTQRVRIERTSGAVAREARCAHDEEEVAAAILALRAQGCAPIFVLGASAIADRRDVIPAAIERAGGLCEHFGMPVDPGNLLLLGRLAGTVIVGVPGCARSPRRSGFDQVVERLAADLPVARADLMTMGVGGLLQEIPTRPRERAGADPEAPAAATPRVAAVVLAAGHSRRMGGDNKLLLPVDGRAMLERVVDALEAAQVAPIVVVTGHQGAEVRAALSARPHPAVRFAENPDHAEGMGTSVRRGITALAALGEEGAVDAALVCLGDMPRLSPRHVAALVGAFAPEAGRAICVPTFQRQRGNPVLFAARYFAELGGLGGDAGARALLELHPGDVVRVPVPDDGVLIDVDTPEALRALRADPPEGG